jgi:coenzyme F420-0:L-glutamate ligase
MIIRPIETRVFREGENLFKFISGYFKKIPERSIVVVTSKIIALAERRTVVPGSAETKAKLVKKESRVVLPTKYHTLTVDRDGTVMTSAGIDASNANGKLILLPKDSFGTARLLRAKLRKKYGVKSLGVLITDSRKAPLRKGIIGAAIGYAGFAGINDYRGNEDIFGRKLKFPRVNVADTLAAAAVLTMGEGNERRPLAVIERTPAGFCDKIDKKELRVEIGDDMYLPLFEKFLKDAQKNKTRR